MWILKRLPLRHFFPLGNDTTFLKLCTDEVVSGGRCPTARQGGPAGAHILTGETAALRAEVRAGYQGP